MTKKRGFTLIELLIVIAILAILAAILFTSLNSAPARARIAKAQADAHELATAVQILALDTGKYPNGCPTDRMTNPEAWDLNAPTAGLTQRPPVGAIDADCQWSAEEVAKWHGPYAPNVPRDPWGRNYFFDPDYAPNNHFSPPNVCPGHPDGISIGSLGPDGDWYSCDDIVVMLRTL